MEVSLSAHADSHFLLFHRFSCSAAFPSSSPASLSPGQGSLEKDMNQIADPGTFNGFFCRTELN